MAVLAGFARRERSERPDGQAEVEADAIEVAGADAGAGQDQQAMLRQELADLFDDRQDRLMAAIHDGAAADLDDLQPGQDADRAPAGDGAGEVAVEQGLPRERRGDVLDGVGGWSWKVSSARGDDGADMFAGERAGQIAGDEAVDDLDLADMARRLEQVEHREFEDRVAQPLAPSSRQRRFSG